MDEVVGRSVAPRRFQTLLVGAFAALALLLASLGLYTVIAYSVTLRTAEIGIRMALGAAPAAVVQLILSRVTWLVGAGIVIGAAASVWLSQFVQALLFGLQPRDPLTLVFAAATLAIVGGLAGWLPAYRASRIDPAEVLREI